MVPPVKLELQSALARALGERRDSSVVFVSAPVEDDSFYPGLGGLFRDQGSDLAGGVLAVLGLPHLAGVGRGERLSRCVVDELGVYVHVGAVHGEAWPGGRTRHLAPDLLVAVADALALVRLRRTDHPDLRRRLAYSLLVDPAHDNGRGIRNLKLYPLAR